MLKSLVENTVTVAMCSVCDKKEIIAVGGCGVSCLTSLLRKKNWSVGKNELKCPDCRRKRAKERSVGDI